MFSKSFIAYALLLAFTTAVNAQASIAPGSGQRAIPPPFTLAIGPDDGIEPPPGPPNRRAIPPPFRLAIGPDEGIEPPPGPPSRRAVNADGVTGIPPPFKLAIGPDDGIEPPPSPPDALLSRAIDAQLLVDRTLASSAKALLQSTANNPTGNGITATPPAEAAQNLLSNRS
ncbi:hypothetical protein H4582DRAFT_1934524 [Lactarius indigo]|nr:hypothetical protein H4582DRAFT_1934524 [Lactarius indigo]